MTAEAPSRLSHHVPDILDCLAQLSNDEVPTPPRLAKAMLDLLPAGVWSEPSYRWLDPCCKSGVFLREIASRLLDGLAAWEPDFYKRRDHIFRNMIFGTSITEMTGYISRRSLYYSRDASSDVSVVQFDTEAGNLHFVRSAHDFRNGKCRICGGSTDLERDGRENHAYSFIHEAYPVEETQNMKFDVVIGNPPYQVSASGHGAQASTIYHHFVRRAIALSPKYLVMITPSRWFSGGFGLDNFRASMINDRRLRAIVDNPKLFDCFPGVEIKGGVNYFLWDRDYDGDCEVSTRVDGVIVSTMTRDLRGGSGILMRDNRAVAVVERVRQAFETASLEKICAPLKYFGVQMMTNYPGSVPEPFEGAIPLIYNNRIGYSRLDQIERNHAGIDRYKVLVPRAGDGHGREVSYVLGEPIAVAPGSACTMSYLIVGMFDTAQETENLARYLATKFVRFLVLQRKVTQDMTADRFRFVPLLDMTRAWTDADLYEHFGLTGDEIAYIESTIQPRQPILSLDSPVPASHLPGGHKYRVAVEPEPDEEDE